MRFTRSIHTIDSHTAGEPTRLVIAGFPPIPGASMGEKWAYCRQHLNDLRRLIMLEPRGHTDMFGAILTPPDDPQADYGLLFCDSGGWLTMCGHGTLGTAISLVQAGMVHARADTASAPGEVTLRFDTPAGLVEAHVEVGPDGSAGPAWFENVPSFLYASDQKLRVEGVGTLDVDIAFGGNFFLLVSAQQLGLSVEQQHARRLVDLGLAILEQANRTFSVQHPVAAHIGSIGLVEITEPGRDGADFRNIVVFGDGNFDRSPCGTGTCARMAELYAKGRLGLEQPFVHESILGTRFEGTLLRETRVGEYPAVIPIIKGSAYITGFNHLVLDPTDPLPEGFNVFGRPGA